MCSGFSGTKGEKGEWEEKWLGRDRQRADVEKKCRRGRKVEARSGWKSWSKGREGISKLHCFGKDHKPNFAKPLHHRALRHALSGQPRFAGKRTMEREVAGWSYDGGVEFRAWV